MRFIINTAKYAVRKILAQNLKQKMVTISPLLDDICIYTCTCINYQYLLLNSVSVSP